MEQFFKILIDFLEMMVQTLLKGRKIPILVKFRNGFSETTHSILLVQGLIKSLVYLHQFNCNCFSRYFFPEKLVQILLQKHFLSVLTYGYMFLTLVQTNFISQSPADFSDPFKTRICAHILMLPRLYSCTTTFFKKNVHGLSLS